MGRESLADFGMWLRFYLASHKMQSKPRSLPLPQTKIYKGFLYPREANMKHTHGMIKSKWLRSVYAGELAAFRRGVRLAFRNDARWMGTRFGMESCFWAMQRAIQ